MSRRIVRVYYLIRFLLGLSMSFFNATYSIFLLGAGLDLLQINLVNTCYMLACFTLDIPMGAFADVYGRKKSFIFSCLLLSLSFFIYYHSHTFAMFILAEVIGALGSSLYSGAFKSWMIDGIKNTKEDFNIKPVYSWSRVIACCGALIGSVIGAYVGNYDLALPWLMSSVSVLATGIVGYFIVTEYRTEMSPEEKSYRAMIQKIIDGYRICKNNGIIKFTILLGFFWGFACAPMNMFWTPRFQTMGLAISSLGWVHSVTQLMIIGGVLLSLQIHRRHKGGRSALLTTLFIFALGIFGSAITEILWISLSMYFVHEMARGMYEPLLDDYLNEEIDHEVRATIQSIQSTLATAGNGIGLILSGAIAKNTSIQTSWLISSLIIFSFLIFFFVKTRK